MTLTAQMCAGMPLIVCHLAPRDHSLMVNSESIDLLTDREKLCVCMEWNIYSYVILGSSGGNPTKFQGVSVRYLNLSLFLYLKIRLSETNNQAQAVDPIANVNNHPQTLVEGTQLHSADATTGFTADADVAYVATLNPSRIDNLIHTSSSSNFNQDDIKVFLQKPQVLFSGLLSTADVVGTSLANVNLPYDIFNIGAMYQDKIRGFAGIRCTIHLRWQINGERFQQGRYMLVAVPTGGSSAGVTSTTASIASHTNTLVQRTQLQRIELDVNCDTEGNMVLPFISCLNFVPIADLPGGSGSASFGQLYQIRLYAYVPLATPAGSTTAAYTVWVHLEDVELIGPAAPQSGKMRAARGRPASEIEQDAANIGPVGRTLTRVSTASAMLSSVPLISDYANGVSWFTSLLAGAANVFGWSKPINLAPANRVVRETLPWFSNVDQADQSLPISLYSSNMVGITPGFSATDVDELDFSFLKTIPAWQSTVSWSTASGAGVQLFTRQNGALANVNNRVTGSGLTITDFIPFQFIANYFHQWRGSIVYTIKFVKTEFHSGRLAFVFFPQDIYGGNGNVRTLATSAYCHREVVDLRYCNEVTFTVPYISSTPWRPTRAAGFFTGYFDCYVIDPLVAPATVSSSVSLIIEISAGPDFEVSVPFPSSLTPYMNATPQSGSMSNPKPMLNECTLVEGTLGQSSPVRALGINSLATVGEDVSSFRTLLKMTNIHSGWAAGSYSSALYVNVIPFAWPILSSLGVTDSTPSVVGDLYGALCSIYCFSRGGVRLKYLDSITSPVVTQPYVTYLNQMQTSAGFSVGDYMTQGATNVAGQNTYASRCCAPQVFHQAYTNLACEVQIPQYHKYHSRVNSEHMVNTAIPYVLPATSLASTFVVAHHYPVTTNTMLARAGSDDVNFGTFISIPPMYQASGLTVE